MVKTTEPVYELPTASSFHISKIEKNSRFCHGYKGYKGRIHRCSYIDSVMIAIKVKADKAKESLWSKNNLDWLFLWQQTRSHSCRFQCRFSAWPQQIHCLPYEWIIIFIIGLYALMICPILAFNKDYDDGVCTCLASILFSWRQSSLEWWEADVPATRRIVPGLHDAATKHSLCKDMHI